MVVRDDIPRLMARQNGVITRSQVLELKETPGYIRIRLQRGEWVEVVRGVYASTATSTSWERQLRSAVLSQPQALVGGRSAALLHGFDGVRPSRPELLVPYGANSRSSIGRLIRARHFDQVATKVLRGFLCTSVAETILTLSTRLAPSLIERYIDDQLVAKKLVIVEFNPILERLEFARQRGLRALRGIVASRADDAYQPPVNELERLLYRLLDRPELPRYVRQLPIGYPSMTATVDACIPEWRLIIEADGRRFHNRQADHDRDRLRDAEALAAGYVVLRLTWEMLRYQPEECLRRLLAIGKQRAGSA